MLHYIENGLNGLMNLRKNLARKAVVILTLTLVDAVACVSYAADCHVEHYNFNFGADTQTKMTVKSGKICTSGFTVRGGGIRSMQVQQAAQHGTAALSSQRLAYMAEPGYVGKDFFIVRISGETMGRRVQSGNTDISIDVTVIP